jgi:hypothetical protein
VPVNEPLVKCPLSETAKVPVHPSEERSMTGAVRRRRCAKLLTVPASLPRLLHNIAEVGASALVFATLSTWIAIGYFAVSGGVTLQSPELPVGTETTNVHGGEVGTDGVGKRNPSRAERRVHRYTHG